MKIFRIIAIEIFILFINPNRHKLNKLDQKLIVSILYKCIKLVQSNNTEYTNHTSIINIFLFLKDRAPHEPNCINSNLDFLQTSIFNLFLMQYSLTNIYIYIYFLNTVGL